MNRHFVLIICLSCIVSCGRFAPPHPPEDLAPKAVSEFSVIPVTDKITLTWRSPDKDIRNKELKDLEGYRVMRVNEKEVNETKPLDDFLVELAFIEDHNLVELDKMRKEAREKGEIARRVKIAPEKKVFSYEDKELVNGETYIYRIIPINQGGEKGKASSIAKVLFKGEQSDVFIAADEESLDQGIPESPFGPETDTSPGSGLLKLGQ